MVKTVAGRVAVGLVGGFHAVGNHLFGHILVVRPFFFFSFTIHTYRLVIVNR